MPPMKQTADRIGLTKDIVSSGCISALSSESKSSAMTSSTTAAETMRLPVGVLST